MARRLRNLSRSMGDDSDESEELESDNEIRFNDEEGNDEDDDEDEQGDEEESEEELLIPSDQDDDSDAPPEDVGFNVSKDSALKSMKNALNVLKNEKATSKNKRKKKNEMFQQQKKLKLAELEKNKLPEDILAAVTDKSLKKHRRIAEEGNNKNNKVTFEEELESLGVEKKVMTDEFIPLNSSKGLVIKPITSTNNKPSSSAIDFKNNALYGSRIKRIDAQGLQRQNAKRRARHVIVN